MVPTWCYYRETYGGGLPKRAFELALPAGHRIVRWLCDKCVATIEDETPYLRAICAATEAIAEYGEGQVAGLSLGELRTTHYETSEATGRELAMRAALDELTGTGLAFSGVC